MQLRTIPMISASTRNSDLRPPNRKGTHMFKSKFFLAVAVLTLLGLIAAVVMQVMEMREFMMF